MLLRLTPGLPQPPASQSGNTAESEVANAFKKPAVNGKVRIGSDLDKDPRLRAVHRRESFLFDVLIPRDLSWRNGIWHICTYLSQRTSWTFFLCVLLSFGFSLSICAHPEVGTTEFCVGGPLKADGAPVFLTYASYWPSFMNSLAVLLLSFYANASLGRYIGAYDACQDLKAAVVNVVTCVMGTTDEQMEHCDFAIEMWRAVNLIHCCTYVLADKHRKDYSFYSFLIPVSEAYGYYDGVTWFGMLRGDERDALYAKKLVEPGSSLSDKRGHVQSKAALLNGALNVRLKRLVHDAMKRGITSAPWPMWAPELRSLRAASDQLKQRALFRIPRVYRASVHCVVFATLICDTFVLGSQIGRLFFEGYEYAWFALLLTVLLYSGVVCACTSLVEACDCMENPFGHDLLDMPALSFVCGTAETTLRMLPHAARTEDPRICKNRSAAMYFLQQVRPDDDRMSAYLPVGRTGDADALAEEPREAKTRAPDGHAPAPKTETGSDIDHDADGGDDEE